jgi:hypothetical protein
MNLPDTGNGLHNFLPQTSVSTWTPTHILSFELPNWRTPYHQSFSVLETVILTLKNCQVAGISLHICGGHVLKDKSVSQLSPTLGKLWGRTNILTQYIAIQINGGEFPGPWEITNFSETVPCRADKSSQPWAQLKIRRNVEESSRN